MPYPYSSQSHTPTASVGPFSYSNVSLLSDVPVKDQIKVYLNGQLKTLTTDYTLTANETVTFNSAVTGTVKIARESDIENKEVTFTNSSVLTAQDLNKNTDQLLFLCQELYDKAQLISLTPVGSIADDSIGSNLLNKTAGSEAVVTTAIFDEAVTEAKIAAGAVTATKIGTDAVIEAKIQDGAVTTDKIADDAVNNDKMSAGAPTWTAGGDVTVSGALTVVGDVTTGAAARPAFESKIVTTSAAYTAAGTAKADAATLSALTTSITTKRNNSKVLVRFVVNYETSLGGAGGATHGVFLLFRDSTELGANTDATPGNRSVGIAPISPSSNGQNLMCQTVIEYVDTLAIAGTYAYSIKAYYGGQTLTLNLNKTDDNANAGTSELASSTVLLQEVFTQ